jgi:hypothetical protein
VHRWTDSCRSPWDAASLLLFHSRRSTTGSSTATVTRSNESISNCHRHVDEGKTQHAILLYRYIITEITPVPHCSTTPYPQFQRSVACCNGSLNYSTPTNGAYQPLHGFPSRLDTQLYYRFCLYNPDNMHHMCEWEGDRHFHRRGDTENPHEALLQPRVGMVANVA